MQRVTVGTGQQYPTITAALQAFEPEVGLILQLSAETFHEKIFSERRFLRLEGAGMGKTRIVWQDGAKHPAPDGKPLGTFRSYTAFFDGKGLELQDLTIENAAGDGKIAGQAIAASVHAEYVTMQRVELVGWQDTLFMGPLPEKERQKDGFLGPRQNHPRVMSYQYYKDCKISGDIDFIFGGASSVFENCHIHAVGQTPGYLAAPSGQADQLGFVFQRCVISAERPASLRLARPWRSYAKAAFLYCDMQNAAAPIGFDPWAEQQQSFVFVEYPQTVSQRQHCVTISQAQADRLQETAKQHCEMIFSKLNELKK